MALQTWVQEKVSIKGVYYDGHERKDVHQARTEFLDQMSHLEKFMQIYGKDKPQNKQEDDMSPQELKLNEEDKEVEVFFHDESAFHANDYARQFWLRSGEVVLKKKEKG